MMPVVGGEGRAGAEARSGLRYPHRWLLDLPAVKSRLGES